jgi:6-phosphogluconolactonase
MLPDDTRILADPEALAATACRLIGDAAREAIRQRGVFRLVLAGGNTPNRTYQRLATSRQQWAAWEIYWGDERCLPADHPQRNSVQARHAWLAEVPIPPGQIHPIPAERGGAAAAIYARLIGDRQPFDLVLLGMGEDGHTAGMFPGAPDDSAAVIAVHNAPKPPAERISLNFDALGAGRQQLVLVSGAEKAAAVAAWQQGEQLPIARATNSHACLLLDAPASRSAGLATSLI